MKLISEEKLENLNNLYNEGNISEVLVIGSKLLEEEGIISNELLFAKLLVLMGNASFLQSEFATALRYYEDSLDINVRIDNKEGLAAALGNIGLAKQNMGEYSIALEYYEKAIQLNKELENQKFLASNLGNAGIVFSLLSDYDRALNYFQKALSINNEIKNISGISSNLGSIGQLFFSQSNFKESLSYYHEALELLVQVNNKKGISTTYINIGNVYVENQELEKALDYYNLAIKICEEIHSKDGLSNCFGAIGKIYFKKNEFIIAKEYLEKSIILAKEIEQKEIYMNGLRLMYEVHESMGDYKRALEYFKEYMSIRDIIHSDETKYNALLFDQKIKVEAEEKNKALKIARMEEQEKLLHNILPHNIAERILQHELSIADYYPSVSVMFIDIVGFTSLSSSLSPKQIVFFLDMIFSKVDDIIEEYGLEKIKTIGDGYLAVANLTKPIVDHQLIMAKTALVIIESILTDKVLVPPEILDSIWENKVKNIQLRIGIHSGEVIAGIVGKNKFVFDLWGDTVNIASRMESQSIPGKIHISNAIAEHISDFNEFNVIPRGDINIKGKGIMSTFWLEKNYDLLL